MPSSITETVVKRLLTLGGPMKPHQIITLMQFAGADNTFAITHLVGTSSEGIDAAIRNGITRAGESLRNLDWFELASVRGAIADGRVSHYQVTLKVGMRLDDAD